MVRKFESSHIKVINLLEETDIIEGEGADFTFFSKIFFGPLFYYLSERN